MLVLSRRAKETIVIDGQITVTILGINGSSVCLGIEAPKQIPVQRQEVWGGISANENHRSEPVQPRHTVI